jgi:hypothetical protein
MLHQAYSRHSLYLDERKAALAVLGKKFLLAPNLSAEEKARRELNASWGLLLNKSKAETLEAMTQLSQEREARERAEARARVAEADADRLVRIAEHGKKCPALLWSCVEPDCNCGREQIFAQHLEALAQRPPLGQSRGEGE